MVKRLDNQPRMEDVFATNSRADNEGKFEHIKYQCIKWYQMLMHFLLHSNVNEGKMNAMQIILM